VMVNVGSESDIRDIQANLPIIESEARLGLESASYARRILEIKGLSADEKTAAIQECIAFVLRRLPQVFDHDVFTEMQHVLVMCPEEFKSVRDAKHISRIICSQYVFRRWLREKIQEKSKKRYLKIRFFTSSIRTGDAFKKVLSLVVGINFLSDKEIFEEHHLLTAIQNYIPKAKAVPHSFWVNRRGKEHISTIYLELEKSDASDFTLSEIKLLKRELPVDLKDRIGHLLHPIFMPRNEEEIMRNVLSLSSQIKYIRDLPQVFITFDEQDQSSLHFTVILVRVSKPGVQSLEEMFKCSSCLLKFTPDRTKMVGLMRKKYIKEATIFRLELEKQDFIRGDHSIDLTKARQTVVDELTHVIGEFRDYNGGMISKQNELLCAIRDELCKSCVKYNELLLENFFYSLTPVIMRTVMDPVVLKKMFCLLLEQAQKGIFNLEEYSLSVQKESGYVFVMITSKDGNIKEKLQGPLSKVPRETASLASCFVTVYDTPCLGYIYRCDEVHNQERFCEAVRYSLMEIYAPQPNSSRITVAPSVR